MKNKILFWLVLGLSLFASLNAVGACLISFYQPELPQALRK